MFTLHSDNDFFYSTKINDDKYFSGFGTNTLKLSDYPQIINTICERQNIDVITALLPKQTHSIKVAVVEASHTFPADVDGLITKEKNIVLCVKTADCVPMLYADKTRGIIAASHQGWRGTYNGMAKEMITKMVEEGADINSVTVEIGPAIGLCCYEVKQDVFSQFKEKYEYMGGTVVLKKDGKFFVNLLELNMKLVQEVGVKKENIEFFPFCTKCNEKQFYSYRRDYKDNYDLFDEQLSFIIKK